MALGTEEVNKVGALSRRRSHRTHRHDARLRSSQATHATSIRSSTLRFANIPTPPPSPPPAPALLPITRTPAPENAAATRNRIPHLASLEPSSLAAQQFTTALREGRIDDFYDEADHLRTELWDQKDMVKDRRYHLKTVPLPPRPGTPSCAATNERHTVQEVLQGG